MPQCFWNYFDCSVDFTKYHNAGCQKTLPFLPADQELVTAGRAGSPEAGPSAGGRETTLRDGVSATSKITPSCWGNRRENTTKHSAGEASTRPAALRRHCYPPETAGLGARAAQHAPPRTGGAPQSLRRSKVRGQTPNPICSKRASPSPQNVLVSSTVLSCLARGGEAPHNVSGRQVCWSANSIPDTVALQERLFCYGNLYVTSAVTSCEQPLYGTLLSIHKKIK